MSGTCFLGQFPSVYKVRPSRLNKPVVYRPDLELLHGSITCCFIMSEQENQPGLIYCYFIGSKLYNLPAYILCFYSVLNASSLYKLLVFSAQLDNLLISLRTFKLSSAESYLGLRIKTGPA